MDNKIIPTADKCFDDDAHAAFEALRILGYKVTEARDTQVRFSCMAPNELPIAGISQCEIRWA